MECKPKSLFGTNDRMLKQLPLAKYYSIYSQRDERPTNIDQNQRRHWYHKVPKVMPRLQRLVCNNLLIQYNPTCRRNRKQYWPSQIFPISKCVISKRLNKTYDPDKRPMTPTKNTFLALLKSFFKR